MHPRGYRVLLQQFQSLVMVSYWLLKRTVSKMDALFYRITDNQLTHAPVLKLFYCDGTVDLTCMQHARPAPVIWCLVCLNACFVDFRARQTFDRAC